MAAALGIWSPMALGKDTNAPLLSLEDDFSSPEGSWQG